MKFFDKLKKFIFVSDDAEHETEEESIKEDTALKEEVKEVSGDVYDGGKFSSDALPSYSYRDFERKPVNELLDTKNRYVNSKSKEDLIAVLKCLTSAKVLVPVTDNGKVRADVMTDSSGGKMLPVFSDRDQIDYDYSIKFSTVEMTFVQAVKLAHVMDGVSAIVLDAFTDSMVINFKLADGVVQMAK